MAGPALMSHDSVVAWRAGPQAHQALHSADLSSFKTKRNLLLRTEMPVVHTRLREHARAFMHIQINAGNCGNADPRLWAGVVAAYVISGCTVWLMLREVRWFTSQRHAFLSRWSFVPQTRSGDLLLQLQLQLQS